jgi:hypothetical protein
MIRRGAQAELVCHEDTSLGSQKSPENLQFNLSATKLFDDPIRPEQ